MCRNIKSLYNFEPPATDSEVQDAALQFVRKISGFHKPSKVNLEAYNRAVENISENVQNLIDALETSQPPKNRAEELEKAQSRNQRRFASGRSRK